MRRLMLALPLLAFLPTLGCVDDVRRTPDIHSPAAAASDNGVSTSENAEERTHMVKTTIAARGIEDPRVLAAMESVPRHRFVSEELRSRAYDDQPLPIGHEQTISQPYIVALMSEALQLDFDGDGRPKVLEIGTGSGYQAAVLDAMGVEVYSIEIIDALARSADQLLDELGYRHVHVRSGDGYQGWPEQAPFDGIIVTAAPPAVPEPLKLQLRDGAHLVIPVGEHYQELIRITRRGERFDQQTITPVRFVPMTGEAQAQDP